MSTVYVDEIAAGVPMRRKALETAMVNPHKIIVYDANGRPRHLEDGYKTVWGAGRHYKYIIVAFKHMEEVRAKIEFEKTQKTMLGKYTPRVFGFGRLSEDDGVEHPAIIEEYIYDVPLVEAIANSGLAMCEAGAPAAWG